MTVHLVTFVAGYENIEHLIQRMQSQAESCSFIDEVYICSKATSNIYNKFHIEHGDFVEKNLRGYGYWLWKPYILYEYIRSLPENDIVLYADIGCELSPSGAIIFNRILKKLKKFNFIFFNTGNNQSEYFWTKREVIELFNLPENLLQKQQVAATFFLMKKTNCTLDFLNQWLKIANDKNHLYLNDKVIVDQHSDFKEHRHDQSILSLMVKKYGLKILNLKYTFSKQLYYKDSPILMFPIHGVRNLTKSAFIQPSMYHSKLSIKSFIKLFFLKVKVKFFK